MHSHPFNRRRLGRQRVKVFLSILLSRRLRSTTNHFSFGIDFLYSRSLASAFVSKSSGRVDIDLKARYDTLPAIRFFIAPGRLLEIYLHSISPASTSALGQHSTDPRCRTSTSNISLNIMMVRSTRFLLLFLSLRPSASPICDVILLSPGASSDLLPHVV